MQVILTGFNGGGRHLLGAVQFHKNAHDLGLDHVLLFTLNATDCAQIPASYVARVGHVNCGWMHVSLPPHRSYLDSLWNVMVSVRFRLIARAVRMGYNVLYMDTGELALSPWEARQQMEANLTALLKDMDLPHV